MLKMAKISIERYLYEEIGSYLTRYVASKAFKAFKAFLYKLRHADYFFIYFEWIWVLDLWFRLNFGKSSEIIIFLSHLTTFNVGK